MRSLSEIIRRIIRSRPLQFALFVALTLFLADATGRVLAGCHRARAVRQAAVVHHGGHHVAAFNAHHAHGYHAPVYYNVGSALREQAVAEKAAEIAVQRFAEKLLSQSASGGNCNTCGPGGATGGGSIPGVPTPPVPSGGDAQAQTIFNASCVRCHTGAGAKGGVDLTNVASLPAAVKGKSAMLAYIGEMPPEGQGEPIGQTEADFLLRWAAGR